MPKENHIRFIDINADVGEGLNNEVNLMPYLSSCNIACGGHAGDKATMTSVVRLSKQHQVKIGAHPSFPDQENFGRLKMEISPKSLLKSLISQVNHLLHVLDIEGDNLHHIKPHGALYNLAITDKIYAGVVISLVKHFDMDLKLYAPYGSLIAKMAKIQTIEVVYEVFADRNYNDDLTLVPRTHPQALIKDAQQMSNHVLGMIVNHKVNSINGIKKSIKADTICIHGDHPQAAHYLQFLTAQLHHSRIQVL